MRRLMWLVGVLALGLAIGALVRWRWNSDAGFLALPVLLALAWLFVADPTRCEPPRGGPRA